MTTQLQLIIIIIIIIIINPYGAIKSTSKVWQLTAKRHRIMPAAQKSDWHSKHVTVEIHTSAFTNCSRAFLLIPRLSSVFYTDHYDSCSTAWMYHKEDAQVHLSSKCNVYTICRQTQLSTRWYVNLLNVNLNYMFRPQILAIIRLYKRKLIN